MFEQILRDHRNNIVSAIVSADRKEQKDEHSCVILEQDALNNLKKLRDDIQEIITLKNQNKLQEALEKNKIGLKILSQLYKNKKMIIKRGKILLTDLEYEHRIIHKILTKDVRTLQIAKELQSIVNKLEPLLLQTETVFNEHLGNIKSQLFPEHGKAEVNFIASQRKISVIEDINTLGLWVSKYSTYSRQLLNLMHKNNGILIEILNKELEKQQQAA